ncbi:unnamed protein product, partial [marine sediment metagenome]
FLSWLISVRLGGKIVSGGQGLDMDEIADALHIKSSEDRGALESVITKLEKRDSLKWNQGVLTVVHYEERQKIAPSSRPEAVAERVRRFRERKKGKKKDDPDKFIKGSYGDKVKR